MVGRWDKAKLAYDFLTANNGAEVTISDISNNTGWTESTTRTYIKKKWAGILTLTSHGNYVVSIPPALNWVRFQALHSQVLIPAMTPTPKVFDYDAALSFAGEDRDYVSQVAGILKAYGIEVFYDTYEQHTLWGKDLYTHLDEVYRLKSRYCVMFISKSYKEKLWTNHERESAQARAFGEQQEYLLPVRLDDTEIPGIRPTVGYISAKGLSPAQLANIISTKLGKNKEFDLLLERIKNEAPFDYEIVQDGENLIFTNEIEDHQVTLSIKMLIEAMKSEQLDVFFMSSLFVW